MTDIRSYPPGAFGAFLKEARNRHKEWEAKQKVVFHDMFHACLATMNPKANDIYKNVMRGKDKK